MLPRDRFSQEQLDYFWQSYIEKMEQEGDRIYANGLQITTHKLVDQKVVLEFPSESVQRDFKEKQNRFQKELSQAVNNYFITFEFLVVEKSSGEEIPVLSEEKYARMLQVNPHIGILTKELNLKF